MTAIQGARGLDDRYANHNAGRGRGFIYGGSERVDALRSAIGPAAAEGVVLDLGCRDGSLATALDLPADRTFGADIDPAALAVAAGSALRPVQANLWGSFPFADASFSLVVAGELVEHVPFPEDLISEVARVLTPDGRFVGSVPNAFRLKNRLTFMTGRWFEQDPTHLRHFSPSMLRGLLRPYFGLVSVRPCVGRWCSAWPRMFGNDLVWSAIRRDG